MDADTQTLSDLDLLVLLPIDRQGDWIDACLLYGGGHEIQLTQVSSAQQMAEQLRQYAFDLLLFWYEGAQGLSAPTCRQLAAMAEHDGFAALGMHAAEGWQHELLGQGAVACLDMDQSDPHTLVHSLRTSCELIRLRGEQRQWHSEQRRQQERDARDVQRLLAGQRQLLTRLDNLGGGPNITQPFDIASNTGFEREADQLIDTQLGNSYCTVLQNYLFDDSQVSGAAMTLLAEHFLATGADSSSIMRLHLAAVSRVTAHGGSNALRHCLASADRFLLELMMRLVDRRDLPIDHAFDSHSTSAPYEDTMPHPVERPRATTSPLAAA